MGKGMSGQNDDQDNVKASLLLLPQQPEFVMEYRACHPNRIPYQKDCLYTKLTFHLKRLFYVICFQAVFHASFSFKCGHPQHWANHRSSYLSSDLPSRAGDSVLTSLCFGELCPCSLQLKCKQQYFTRDLIQMYLNSFCWLFLFFNVKGCSIWLAIFEMCTDICRFF